MQLQLNKRNRTSCQFNGRSPISFCIFHSALNELVWVYILLSYCHSILGYKKYDNRRLGFGKMLSYCTRIVNGIWSDCLLYQKPLSHMGIFSALFAEVEQLCGRFLFLKELISQNWPKKPKTKQKQLPKNKHHQKSTRLSKSCTWE